MVYDRKMQKQNIRYTLYQEVGVEVGLVTN